MTHIVETPLELPHVALPGADWGDAFTTHVKRPFQNARAAGAAAYETFPPWVHGLMALRNIIVAPFGLKTGHRKDPKIERIGFFPLIAESNEQLILGMNDRHLDFRIIVDLYPVAEGQDVTLSTVLKRHNSLGRAYLFVIKPFHKAILRITLKRLAQRQNRRPYLRG